MSQVEYIIRLSHEKPCGLPTATEIEAILCRSLSMEVGIFVKIRGGE